jgi:hypothetical protein
MSSLQPKVLRKLHRVQEEVVDGAGNNLVADGSCLLTEKDVELAEVVAVEFVHVGFGARLSERPQAQHHR